MMDYSMGSAAEVDNPEAEEIMRPFLDRLDPALVVPVVAYLAHTDCSVSGEIYTVGGGQVSRFFIDRTKGYYNPSLTGGGRTRRSTPSPRDPSTRWWTSTRRSPPASAAALQSDLLFLLR